MQIDAYPPRRSAILEESFQEDSPWSQQAYFEDRVDQELYRSRRYQTDTSILLVRIPALSRRAARCLHTYVATQLRAIDSAGMLNTGDYVVCLPHTPRRGGEVVAGRIRAFLDDYAPQIGVASYGEDGKELESLLASAAARMS